MMEEVWKDYYYMSSSSSSTPAAHHQQRPPPSPPYQLQDFLASAAAPLSHSSPQQPPTPPPLPPTALSLSSTLEFTYLGGGGDPFAPAAPFPPALPRMMTGGGEDRRHKRMIKNRESAARSRARRQAYTNELELALAQLRQENAMLILRHQELNVRLAMTAQAPDKPSSVQRCRSAPP